MSSTASLRTEAAISSVRIHEKNLSLCRAANREYGVIADIGRYTHLGVVATAGNAHDRFAWSRKSSVSTLIPKILDDDCLSTLRRLQCLLFLFPRTALNRQRASA